MPIILLSSLTEANARTRGIRAGAEIRLMENKRAEDRRDHVGIQGDFEVEPIQELVQILENSNKTGELTLIGEDLFGYILIHRGKFVDAGCVGYRGRLAVQVILELRSGELLWHRSTDLARDGMWYRSPFVPLS